MRFRGAARGIGLAAVVASLTACGSTATPSAAPLPTHVAATTSSAAPKPASMVKVPNGVGLDYQSAQDLWRGAGLHVLPATDATGAHRLPVIDSNWVVLAQNLKAGSKVPVNSFITATVKKFSDS